MKVIKSGENYLFFDNGLEIVGDGDEDCCAYNYIDFEQFTVGREFRNMTAKGFARYAKIKDDGFSLKDNDGVPAWAQARSDQNGYYSAMTTLIARYKGEEIDITRLEGEENDGF